jgi:hypothetical protein
MKYQLQNFKMLASSYPLAWDELIAVLVWLQSMQVDRFKHRQGVITPLDVAMFLQE